VAAFVATPLGRYILRAGWEESKILARRRPIEEVIADSGTSSGLRDRLTLVIAARQYAVDSLRLNAGESFTTFAQLDRDTLVLVLSAAYRDRLVAYRWWFPIVGTTSVQGLLQDRGCASARGRTSTRGGSTPTCDRPPRSAR
jgi:predicted aminopeptidase